MQRGRLSGTRWAAVVLVAVVLAGLGALVAVQGTRGDPSGSSRRALAALNRGSASFYLTRPDRGGALSAGDFAFWRRLDAPVRLSDPSTVVQVCQRLRVPFDRIDCTFDRRGSLPAGTLLYVLRPRRIASSERFDPRAGRGTFVYLPADRVAVGEANGGLTFRSPGP